MVRPRGLPYANRVVEGRAPALISWLLGAALALGLALPAVTWEPLHRDELVTLDVAQRSLGAIVDRVFVERGGGPVHFFVEHVALRWPGGLEGLRLPSLAFFLAALPAAGLLARELAGDRVALLVVPALAVSPLAVELATFGRMYSLFLAGVLWATWGAIRLGRRDGIALWAAGGALLGLLVYVHPLAPLYGGLGLVTALLVAARNRSAWAAPAAFLAAGLPYYLHGLARNRERYKVHAGGERIETTHGRGVPTEILHALTPGGTIGALAFGALALLGLAWLLARKPRSGLALGLWVLLPVAFFSFVPVEGTRFFARYVLPALPAVLVLAVAGGLALGLVHRWAAVVAPVLVAASLVAVSVEEDAGRLVQLHGLGLSAAVDAVRGHAAEGILFASTGRTTYSRSPRLLSAYIGLRAPDVQRVRERSCAETEAFLRGPARSRVGLWLFRGRTDRLLLAQRRLADVESVASEPISSELLLVKTVRAEPPTRLIELGALVRRAWLYPEYGDGGTEGLIRVDLSALGAAETGLPCSEVDVERPVPYEP